MQRDGTRVVSLDGQRKLTAVTVGPVNRIGVATDQFDCLDDQDGH